MAYNVCFLQARKTEYDTLAPVCTSCLQNGHFLSLLCNPGDPKTALDNQICQLENDWMRLEAVFRNIFTTLSQGRLELVELTLTLSVNACCYVLSKYACMHAFICMWSIL